MDKEGAGKGLSEEKFKNLMDTVSFELDTDLRLLAQKADLGKAELLTDAIVLPFRDIEKDLDAYALTGGEQERERLKGRMKNYLARLNANPLLPLHFRLKVLDRFERELDLFDGELTAAVLNAHKIGLELVQKAARENADYLRVLVDMAGNAIEVAVRLLRLGFERYEPPHPLAVRQVLDIARLALVVAHALPENEQDVVSKLYKAVANHELLRRIDMHARSRREQRLVWGELQAHVSLLEPRFVYRDAFADEKLEGTLLVSWVVRPNRRPEVTNGPPEKVLSDAVVIPLDPMVDRLVVAVDRVQKLVRHLSEQTTKRELITEEVLQRTLVGGQAILEALAHHPRHDPRRPYAGKRVVLEWNAARAIAEARAAAVLDAYEFAPKDITKRGAWSVTDVSRGGVGLERVSFEPFRHEVGSLVSLSWIPHENEPTLGIVRWFKEPKPGEQRLGIAFLREKFKLYRGVPLYAEQEGERRSWPVLLRRQKDGLHAILPEPDVPIGFVFAVAEDGRQAFLKVHEIVRHAPNFSRVKVVPARVREPARPRFDF